MSLVDENDKARDLPERAAKTRHLSELGDGHRREDWLDFLPEACEPTPGQPGSLQTQVAGHRWHVGRCLSGDEDFSAACSCGWGCTQTGSVAAMLGQVKEHLAAVRELPGGRPSPRVPACSERKRKASQRAIRPHQRARELRAAVAGQQMRLSQSLRHSTDLLSACAGQADRLVASLKGGECAKTTTSAHSAETARRKIERARELRKAISAAGVALAGMAQEAAWIDQDLETWRPGGAECQPLVGVASETAGTARHQ